MCWYSFLFTCLFMCYYSFLPQELLQKLEQTHFPWFWVVFLLISTLSAIIAYDIYSSKTLKGLCKDKLVKS